MDEYNSAETKVSLYYSESVSQLKVRFVYKAAASEIPVFLHSYFLNGELHLL